MTSGGDVVRPDVDVDRGPKGRCLKCAYPVDSGCNVLAVISRFKEMLHHAGYLTGRLVVNEDEGGVISISITMRPAPAAPPSASKNVEENPPATARPLTLGTSSCCSTNSLCKAHACHHREEASKPPAPVRVAAGDIQYPGADQTEPSQFGTDPNPIPGCRPTQAQQRHHVQLQTFANKGQMFCEKGATSTGGVTIHQPQQKMDEAEQMSMHRTSGGAGSIQLLGQQHMGGQKQHGSSHQDEVQLPGNPMQQGSQLSIMNSGMVEAHNDKSGDLSKKQNVQLGGRGQMRDRERHVHQDQTMVPAQQSRLHWSTSADRLGTAVDLPFPRGIQGRNYPREVQNTQRTMQHGQGSHGMQQTGDGLPHDITRGLSGDLQIMEQSSDGYGQISLGDDPMHGSSGTVTPVQRRLQMQQVNPSDQWTIPSRSDNVMGSCDRDTEGNRMSTSGVPSDEARSVGGGNLSRRIDYGGLRTGQSPPAKRARNALNSGTVHGMSGLGNQGATGGGVSGGVSSGMDLQTSGLVNAAAVGLQAGGLVTTGLTTGMNTGLNSGMSSGMVNSGPIGEAVHCEQCGKNFANDVELQKHSMKEHRAPAARNEQGRYPCTMTDCEQSFVRRHVMERHVRTVHLKIREFPCEACGRKFADSSTREVHRSAVHEKKKPWNCDICMATFTQSSSLGKHKRRFHGEGKQKGTAVSHGDDA